MVYRQEGLKEMSDYFINASDLDYNMLSDYICSSDMNVLYLWWIVPVIVIIFLILNSYTLK